VIAIADRDTDCDVKVSVRRFLAQQNDRNASGNLHRNCHCDLGASAQHHRSPDHRAIGNASSSVWMSVASFYA
jgi:hypothetical protein